MKIGTRVQFNRRFLQSTGQHYGKVPFLKGEVIDFKPEIGTKGLCRVRWDSGEEQNVLAYNLAEFGKLDHTGR